MNVDSQPRLSLPPHQLRQRNRRSPATLRETRERTRAATLLSALSMAATVGRPGLVPALPWDAVRATPAAGTRSACARLAADYSVVRGSRWAGLRDEKEKTGGDWRVRGRRRSVERPRVQKRWGGLSAHPPSPHMTAARGRCEASLGGGGARGPPWRCDAFSRTSASLRTHTHTGKKKKRTSERRVSERAGLARMPPPHQTAGAREYIQTQLYIIHGFPRNGHQSEERKDEKRNGGLEVLAAPRTDFFTFPGVFAA